MKIIISPFSQKLRNGKENPKNFPYWSELIEKLKKDNHEIIQIGVKGERQLTETFKPNLRLKELAKLLQESDLWISVDNFFPHFANHYKKRGIAIFGKSDPNIYGYPQNINLLKDRKYLREKPFDIWEAIEFDKDAFVSADEVLYQVKYFIVD